MQIYMNPAQESALLLATCRRSDIGHFHLWNAITFPFLISCLSVLQMLRKEIVPNPSLKKSTSDGHTPWEKDGVVFINAVVAMVVGHELSSLKPPSLVEVCWSFGENFFLCFLSTHACAACRT